MPWWVGKYAQVAVVLKSLQAGGIEDAKRVKKSKYLRDLISVFLEIGVTSRGGSMPAAKKCPKVAQLMMLKLMIQ